MDLHRTGRRSQWDDVPAHKRSWWQRVASRTNGAVTPGNAVSFGGAALVAWGLVYVYNGALGSGLLLLSAGRLADIADGMVASRTKTKSPLGEIVDAVIDKLSMLAALIVFVAAGVVPLLVIVLFAFFNILNVLLGVVARMRKRALHPSWAGKYAAAFQWAAFLAYVAVELLEARGAAGASAIATVAAGVAVAIAALVGIAAARGYIRMASGTAGNTEQQA